jgi:hypothetical protein
LQNNLFCFETFVKNKNIRVNRPCRPIGFWDAESPTFSKHMRWRKAFIFTKRAFYPF